MPESSSPVNPGPSEVEPSGGEQIRPLATRRDFLVGAGAGAVVVGVVAGGGIAVTRSNAQPTQTVQTAPGQPAVAVAPPPAVQTQPGDRSAAGGVTDGCSRGHAAPAD